MQDARDTTERAGVADLLRTRAGEAMELNQRYLNPQLGRVVQTLGFDRDWAHGRGSLLIDRDGNEYLDMLSGYGVFALGRSHPYVKEQLASVLAADTATLPQLGAATLPGVLAERLVALAPSSIDAVVLCSSGTEAVEGALKLARAATGRPRVLHCERGFHGLTIGSLSVNGNEEFRERFGPLLPGCDPVPFGDVAALRAELERGDVAAFIVEPVQGKGVYLAPDGYLAAAQEACHDAGALLIADEVQTGFGRTGKLFASEHSGLVPDILISAKSIAGGLPLAAITGRAEVMDAPGVGGLGGTFGGNPVALAAAHAVLDTFERGEILARANAIGAAFAKRAEHWKSRFGIVGDVRCIGAMGAIELVRDRQEKTPAKEETSALAKAAYERGLLTITAGTYGNIIRTLMPLVITDQELEEGLLVLEHILSEARPQ